MDDIKLPPLPEPYSRQWINCPFTERLLFTEDQMHAYARAALAAAPTPTLLTQAECEQLRAELQWCAGRNVIAAPADAATGRCARAEPCECAPEAKSGCVSWRPNRVELAQGGKP